MRGEEFLVRVRSETEATVQLIRALVELESPSTDKVRVDRLGAFLIERMRQHGLQPRIEPREEVGDIVWTEWANASSQGRLLVLCHIDTVWEPGTLERNPFRLQDGKVYGPGILDMKGGVALTLKVQEFMQRGWIQPRRRVRFVYTTDEEIFSAHSQDLIRNFARQSDMVLVLEPPTREGALKTARKGVGNFVLQVHGKAAHAGVEPEKGINAVVELAHQILAIQQIASPQKETSVVVTVVRGGSRANVVPEAAEAVIDTRFKTSAEARRVERSLRELVPQLPGARLELSGGIDRPPMERTEKSRAVFESARRIAAELGLELQEGESGGGSDGNFTAGEGIPTLDGLGIDGQGIHALHEHIELNAIAPRSALLAKLIEQL